MKQTEIHVPLSAVRMRLTALLNDVKMGASVVILERGEGAAAIISADRYLDWSTLATVTSQPATELDIKNLVTWIVAYGETPETAERIARLMYAFGYRQLAVATVGSCPDIDPATGEKRTLGRDAAPG